MTLEQLTLIKIDKETKERFEEQLFLTPDLLKNLHNNIILNDEYNTYIKLEAEENYFLLYKEDIFSSSLSIFRRLNSVEDIKDIQNYTLRLIEEVEEEIREYEEEQERLRLEEESIEE